MSKELHDFLVGIVMLNVFTLGGVILLIMIEFAKRAGK